MNYIKIILVKKSMPVKKKMAVIVFLITNLTGWTQDVSFTASGPQAVKVGERFSVTYKANAKPGKFMQPGFPESFNILAGPSTSSSSSVQIVNGQVTRNYSYAYTYYLQATESGQFAINPPKIQVKGQTHQSNPLQIEVVGSGSSASSGNRSSSGTASASSSQGGSAGKSGNRGEGLFLRVLTDKRNVYQGEVIIATAKIYSKVNLSSIQNVKQPSFQGFFKEDIETPDLHSLERENVNGEIYGTGVIQRFAIFPQHSGEIVIEPYEMDCIYKKRVSGRSRSIFDDFFGTYENAKTTIKSDPLTIRVKPLPDNKPASFTGAVGKFDFSASIDKNQVKANEGITMTIRVSGNGNMRIIDAPDISFPPDFEVYDPEISLNSKTSVRGVSGSKTFEILMIPRHAGNYMIPPLVFSYFNPATGKYQTLRSSGFDIEVQPGETGEGTNVITGLSKEDIKFLGKDIRYIKTGNVSFRKKGDYLVSKTGFHLIYLVSFLAFVAIIILMRRKIRQNADISRVKNRRANKFAKKRLKTAATFLKQHDKHAFYDETLKAIWGYLSDKMNIPISELSKDKIKNELEQQKISNELVNELFNIINNCEFARYAPVSEDGEMEKIYSQTVRLISRLQGQIK